MSEPRPRVARSDVLAFVRDELDALDTTAATLQAALAEVLTYHGGLDPQRQGAWQMQELDRVQQTLADLSAIVGRLAEDKADLLDADALFAVARLGDLRARLRGGDADKEGRQTSGTVAFF